MNEEGESDAGSELETEMVEGALIVRFRADLEAVEGRARLGPGTTAMESRESGVAIPDEQLKSEPLAELTVEEQRRSDAGGPTIARASCSCSSPRRDRHA